jgi:trimethylamine--corrinoid protein Co-methyltransferase
MAKPATAERGARASRGGRSGRGGREGRQARHEAAERPAPAYITRRIPFYELLSEEGLDLIERHADRILGEVGVEFRGDEEALRLFKEAGAEVAGERVRFAPGQVRALCATAPSQFTQHARPTARPSCATWRAGGATAPSRTSPSS